MEHWGVGGAGCEALGVQILLPRHLGIQREASDLAIGRWQGLLAGQVVIGPWCHGLIVGNTLSVWLWSSARHGLQKQQGMGINKH